MKKAKPRCWNISVSAKLDDEVKKLCKDMHISKANFTRDATMQLVEEKREKWIEVVPW